MPSALCAQFTRDMFAIAKFLFYNSTTADDDLFATAKFLVFSMAGYKVAYRSRTRLLPFWGRYPKIQNFGCKIVAL